MKQPNIKHTLCALALATTLSACGTGKMNGDPLAQSNQNSALGENGNQNLSDPNASGPDSSNVNPGDEDVGISAGTTLETSKELSVTVQGVPDGNYRELLGKKVTIPAGTSLSVLETKMVENQGLMLRLGIDANEEAGLPSDIWVSAGDIPEDALAHVEDGDYENDDAAVDSPSDEYLDPTRKTRKARKKMTYCYRYVKQYLLKTGKVKTYLPGTSAYTAANTLPKYGFHKTGHSPATAQEGEVCVYRGGNGGNGHIEVKRGGKWWYGYGFKPNPITPNNHPFIGCYAK